MAQFQKGGFLFLGSIQEVFEVVSTTEKAICVSRESTKNKTWLPISGLDLQKRNPLLHVSTPDTFKIKQWVRVAL